MKNTVRVKFILFVILVCLTATSLISCKYADAYELYMKSFEKTDSVTQYSATVEYEIEMSTTGMTMNLGAKGTMAAKSTDNEDIEMLIDMDVTYPTLTDPIKAEIYYKDGIGYFNTADTKYKIETSYDDIKEKSDSVTDIEFPEEAFKDAKITKDGKNKIIRAMVDGEILKELITDMLSSVSDSMLTEDMDLNTDTDFTLSDVSIEIAIDKDDYLKGINMAFDMSASYSYMESDINASVNMKITYDSFSDVNIEPPSDLDEYETLNGIFDNPDSDSGDLDWNLDDLDWDVAEKIDDTNAQTLYNVAQAAYEKLTAQGVTGIGTEEGVFYFKGDEDSTGFLAEVEANLPAELEEDYYIIAGNEGIYYVTYDYVSYPST